MTDLVICSDSREEKTSSYSQVKTVIAKVHKSHLYFRGTLTERERERSFIFLGFFDRERERKRETERERSHCRINTIPIT